MNQQSPSRTYRIWPRRADWLMQLVIQATVLSFVSYLTHFRDFWLAVVIPVFTTALATAFYYPGHSYETKHDKFCVGRSPFGLVTVSHKCYDWQDVYVLDQSKTDLLLDIKGDKVAIPSKLRGYEELASTIRASCAKLPALTISNGSPAFGLDGNLIDKVRVGLIRGEKIQQASMIKANLAVSFNEAMLIVTAIEQAQHGS